MATPRENKIKEIVRRIKAQLDKARSIEEIVGTLELMKQAIVAGLIDRIS